MPIFLQALLRKTPSVVMIFLEACTYNHSISLSIKIANGLMFKTFENANKTK
jgi:hypothetical protein